MALYNYRVRNNQGAIESGSMEAESEDAVLSKLKNMGFLVIELTKSSKAGKKNLSINLNFFSKIKNKDIAIFTRQFSTLILSGLSLIESLTVLGEQEPNKRFSEIILDVRKNIESGLSLSESLAKHEDVFSRLYISMVSAGEMGGTLDKTLDSLATFLEKENEMKMKIRNKSAYPKFVLVFAFVIVIAIIIFIVPTFKGIYVELGAELPSMTKILIFIGDLFKKWYFYLILIVLVVGGRNLYRKVIKTPKGRYQYDNLRISLPKIGDILKKISLSRFSRNLGTLTSAGVPILKALDIAKGISDNIIIDNAIEKIRIGIREGENIAIPMARFDIFPPMMIQMVSVGERSGSLDNMLNKIADFYDDEVSNSIDIIITIIEPMLLLLVGVIVGFIVISMYLPMFNVYKAM